MQYSFQLENIRCDGCTNTITKNLKKIDGVKDVHVNVDEKKVIVTTEHLAIHANICQTLGEKLAKLGYPETGTMSSNPLMTKVISVVSCILGKVSKKFEY